MLLPYWLVVSLSSDNTGLAGSLVCTATDAGGTVRSLSALVWTEEISGTGGADSGTYSAVGQFDPAWPCPLKIKITLAGLSTVAALVVSAADLAQMDTSGLLRVNIPPAITTDVLVGPPSIATGVS